MLAAGLVAEVTRLQTQGFAANPSAAGAIGYRETLAMLDGQMTASELLPAIVANTRALVKTAHVVSHPAAASSGLGGFRFGFSGRALCWLTAPA
jgi:hypothetical protein